MNNSHKGIWALVIIIALVVIAAVIVFMAGNGAQQSGTSGGTTPAVNSIEAKYSCDAGKNITAMYMNATTSTTTGNTVILTLSDGRTMTLPQTISADGARYSNGNPQVAEGQPGAETFIFWSKGNGAFIEENGTTTYDNCLAPQQQ